MLIYLNICSTIGSTMKTTTVSVKITLDERKRLRELDIKPSGVLKAALDREIRAREIDILMTKARKLRKAFAKLPVERVVKDIREDRDSR